MEVGERGEKVWWEQLEGARVWSETSRDTVKETWPFLTEEEEEEEEK